MGTVDLNRKQYFIKLRVRTPTANRKQVVPDKRRTLAPARAETEHHPQTPDPISQTRVSDPAKPIPAMDKCHFRLAVEAP